MPNQPGPLPRDGIYRSILLVLVITILAGALLALAGEYLLASEAAKTVGVGVVLISGALYFFFRLLGRRAARHSEEGHSEEGRGEEDGGPQSPS